MSYIFKKGATSQSIEVYIIDSSDGTPETGVVFNTAGIDLKYRRKDAAVVSITEADLTSPALTDTWETGGFLEIGNGVYRLDLPDAALASAAGIDRVVVFGTVTGMVVLPVTIHLTDIDLNTALSSSTIGTCTTNTDLVTAAAIKTAIEAGGSSLAQILADTETTLDGLIKDIPTVAEFEARSDVAGTAATPAEVASALGTYDAPTKAEMDAAHALLATVAKQDVIDGIVDAIKVIADWQRSVSGTVVVNNPGTDTIFDLTAVIGTLSTEDDIYNNMQLTIYDLSGSIKATRKVNDFDGGNGRFTVDRDIGFPVDDGVDTFILWNKYSPTAAAGGGATAQEVHEYDVSGITTQGQAGYEIQQRGGSSIFR